MKASAIEKLKSVFSFFTTIPVRGDIETAAGSLYALPLVSFIIVIMAQTFALSEINGSFLLILSFLLTAELSAKLSMLTVLAFGDFREGLGMMFKGSFKISHFFYFLLISLIFIFLIRYYWFMLAAGFAAGYIISKISKMYFGGASGDIIGAANELSRVITMLLMCLAY